MPKPKFDKSKYSKAGKEQHPVKVVSTKRPITKPPAKDKAVLNSVRWASGGRAGARDSLLAGSCEARHPGAAPLRCQDPFSSWLVNRKGVYLIHQYSQFWTVQAGKRTSVN